MSFGGRSRAWRRTTAIDAPERSVGTAVPQPCLTESFDGATAFALGPDVTWDEYSYSDGSPTGSTSHVHDDVCSLYLDAGDTSANATLVGRSPALAADVEVTMDIVSTPVVPSPAVNGEAIGLGIHLFVRMDDHDLSGDMPTPLEAFYASVTTATFLSVGGPTWNYEFGWRTATYSASFPSGINTFEGNPTSIGFKVTGVVGSTIVMEMSVDGAVIATYTHADIIADGWTDYADDPTYTPSGATRCGFGLSGGVEFSGGGQFSDINDELTVDNWQACPA